MASRRFARASHSSPVGWPPLCVANRIFRSTTPSVCAVIGSRFDRVSPGWIGAAHGAPPSRWASRLLSPRSAHSADGGGKRMHRRRPLIVALLALLAFPGLALAAGRATSVVQITHDQDRDAETSIAINPRDMQNVIAGWSSSGDLNCGYGASFDGGRTWPVVGVVR